MDQGTSTKCYIEEIDNGKGRLSARLREKGTGRRVDLRGVVSVADKRHFTRFMNAVGASKTSVPDVFTKDGDHDCIVISGDVDIDSPDELRFVHNDNISYLFA
ncbi:hypothetical protein [Cryobacterium zhongshanensis]|uniref:Uncharacterized protein n=1 Tax=Cryobacterium zhongshanensis TaxID=2928153 RepID=A0AA41QY98_9MICO|nr:hypothetical protein [Cryobacterium zhongshanensis]MCI4659727.1 hypothetical protein [Cryobacterium zhongshanensis]